jgi:hypothetical protein
MKRKTMFFVLFFMIIPQLLFATNSVFYSISPYGTGDIKTGSPTITISSGVATLSVEQTGNIGVGCEIDFDPNTNTIVYIAPNRLGFDSGGTTELKINNKIEGGSSGATGIVRAIEVTGGSWAGGDASGWIYFSETEGTWENNEQINKTKPSASSNIATVDGTLNGNIGNGNTQFVVKTAVGADAANVASAQTVNSIHHEYASLSTCEAGFVNVNHINDSDLTNADVAAYMCCYYDHDDQTLDITGVTINFGTTGSNNYVYCYTPVGNSESINDQRHDGAYDPNKYVLAVNAANCILVQENYTKLDGIQFKSTAAVDGKACVLFGNLTFGNNLTQISNAIMKGVLSGDASSASGGIISTSNNNLLNIFNCIIYDFVNGANATNGISCKMATNSAVYNCTVHNCYTGIKCPTDYRIHSKNNIVNDCTDSFSGIFNAASINNITDLSAEEGSFGATYSTGAANNDTENHLIDANATFITDGVQINVAVKNTTDTTYGYVTAINSETDLTLDSDVFPDGDENYSVYTNLYGSVVFNDEGGDDFHLDASDTIANDNGADLSSDALLAVWNDIDGDERASDIGADEDITVELPQLLLIKR